MRQINRILDANANRSREALRVMEEAARFLLDDAPLTARLKQLRHDLAAALKKLPGAGIELHRDTPGDVGTRLSTRSEKTRSSAAEVVIAAGKRLGESLRSLEEYGKLVDPAFAARIERIRYCGYTAEKLLHQRLPAGGAQWRLCVIVTESLCRLPWLKVAQAAVDAGADCIQLREKSLGDGQWLRRVEKLLKIAKPQAAVIVNDRPDIAMIAGADGVHLGEFDLPPAEVRKLAGRRLIIGASTHNLTEARAAISAGVDYCGVGAIYPTATKQRTPSGLKYLRQFVKTFPGAPHLAIGGITPDTIRRVIAAGARGVAVSSVVCGSDRPDRVVRRLLGHIPR